MRIILYGTFNEEDLKEFARVLRKIERKNPIEFYSMFIEDEKLKLEQAKELVKRIYEAASKETG